MENKIKTCFQEKGISFKAAKDYSENVIKRIQDFVFQVEQKAIKVFFASLTMFLGLIFIFVAIPFLLVQYAELTMGWALLVIGLILILLAMLFKWKAGKQKITF